MDRSKRTPKTPKRFDEEAFITPPRVRENHQPKPQAQTIEKVKTNLPEVEIKPPKSIIKVKLAKRDSRPSKLQDTSSTEIATPKPKEQIKIEPPEPVVKIKEEIIEPVVKQVKQEKISKKENIKLKEITKTTKEVTAKTNNIAKHKEPNKSVTPKIEPKTPDRDPPIVFRPKTKRPRTPPVYADLIPNVILPFWDARTAAEDHEDDNVKELVHCHCGIVEESGLMVQCETCLTWQHAHCLGFEQPEDAPDGYTCKACSDPKFARESMKWAYDQDWLTKGRMKQFPCDKNPIPERNIDVLKLINNLIGSALRVHQIIDSLRIKYRLLEKADDDDPELKLFRVMWPPTYQHNSFVPNPLSQQMVATPDECRANLKLHIQQTEEFVSLELAQIEEKVAVLEKECATNLHSSLDSLKADLKTIKNYLLLDGSL